MKLAGFLSLAACLMHASAKTLHCSTTPGSEKNCPPGQRCVITVKASKADPTKEGDKDHPNSGVCMVSRLNYNKALQIFNYYDANDDDRITFGGAYTALFRLEPKATEDQLNEMVTDKNGNLRHGSVNYQTFIAMYKELDDEITHRGTPCDDNPCKVGHQLCHVDKTADKGYVCKDIVTVPPTASPGALTKNDRNQINDIYRGLNIDKTSKGLSKEELSHLLHAVTAQLDKTHNENLYKAVQQSVYYGADSDKDGTVDYTEFVKAMANLKSRDPKDFNDFLKACEVLKPLEEGSPCVPFKSTSVDTKACPKGFTCTQEKTSEVSQSDTVRNYSCKKNIKLESDEISRLKNVFFAMDKQGNGDHKVQRYPELYHMFTTVRDNLDHSSKSYSQAYSAIDRFIYHGSDSDNDGVITLTEFLQAATTLKTADATDFDKFVDAMEVYEPLELGAECVPFKYSFYTYQTTKACPVGSTCQVKQALTTSAVTTQLPKGWKLVCKQSGWTTSGNKCYKYFAKDGLEYHQMQSSCARLGGSLAQIDNDSQMSVVTKIINGKKALIGLNDMDNEGKWQWANGQPAKYTNWLPGEPNNYNHNSQASKYVGAANGEDCTAVSSNGKWNDVVCGSSPDSEGYVCSASIHRRVPDRPAKTTTTPKPTPLVCSDKTWTTSGDKCFRYFATDGMSYSQLESKCQSYGGMLARIDSKEQNDVVSKLANGKHAFFGLSDQKVEGKWVYPDGHSYSFTNWSPGEPNNRFNKDVKDGGDLKNGEDCAVLNFSPGGKWNDVPCNPSIWSEGFVCSASIRAHKPVQKRRKLQVRPTPSIRLTTTQTPFTYSCAKDVKLTKNEEKIVGNLYTGLDKDSDGKLSRTELYRLVQLATGNIDMKTAEGRRNYETLKHYTYYMADKNHDGTISKDEMKKAMTNLKNADPADFPSFLLLAEKLKPLPVGAKCETVSYRAGYQPCVEGATCRLVKTKTTAPSFSYSTSTGICTKDQTLTTAETAKIKNIFAALDGVSSKDDKVTSVEMLQMYNAVREVAHEKGNNALYYTVYRSVGFYTIDTDKNHYVDIDEFIAGCTKLKNSDPDDFPEFLAIAKQLHPLKIGQACSPYRQDNTYQVYRRDAAGVTTKSPASRAGACPDGSTCQRDPETSTTPAAHKYVSAYSYDYKCAKDQPLTSKEKVTVQNIFHGTDSHHDNKLDRAELRQILTQVSTHMDHSDADYNLVYSAVSRSVYYTSNADANHDGMLEYSEFEKTFLNIKNRDPAVFGKILSICKTIKPLKTGSECQPYYTASYGEVCPKGDACQKYVPKTATTKKPISGGYQYHPYTPYKYHCVKLVHLTSSETTKMKNLFHMLDSNNDNKLSYTEYRDLANFAFKKDRSLYYAVTSTLNVYSTTVDTSHDHFEELGEWLAACQTLKNRDAANWQKLLQLDFKSMPHVGPATTTKDPWDFGDYDGPIIVNGRV